MNPLRPIILILLALAAFFPRGSAADPSCKLTEWLADIDSAANAYAQTLGTPDQIEAARQLRRNIDLYDRESLVKQIEAGDFGENTQALYAYIESRHHLLTLEQGNGVTGAARYSGDPRFSRQSAALTTYLGAVGCDPNAPDYLSNSGEEPSLLEQARYAASEAFEEIFAPEPEKPEPNPFNFDPNDFDDLQPSLPTPKPRQPIVPETPSSNLAFFLGIFTFFFSSTFWGWLRYGIVQKRSQRHPCLLPVTVISAAGESTAEIHDISQLGGKLDCEEGLTLGGRLEITIGPVTRRARVAWANNHFAGVTFDKILTEAEMKEILGPFADRIARARAREEARRAAERLRAEEAAAEKAAVFRRAPRTA